ncbi:hypothetical protein SAY87_021715 [Trapa incisa]|uniref:BHLH domain-containing protein n=1 Tax=Trapa incisa TaxID=236973 RepID=A0AAN7JTN2_9MYRT|nr:hypothetical protein SAY87_021715 [Trapa incisa]
MSGRRSRSSRQSHQYLSSSSSISGAITHDQIADLVSKLQQLLPELRSSRHSNKVPDARVLQDTCNYIKSMQREVDDLSERLGELLAASDSDEAAVIRRLLSR